MQQQLLCMRSCTPRRLPALPAVPSALPAAPTLPPELRCLPACSGPSSPSPKRVTLRTLRDKYVRGEPISMVTAYDYPSAVHVRSVAD